MSQTRRSPTRTRQTGQGLVELAIILPFLLALLFGAIDAIQTAMVLYSTSQAVNAAVREAALTGGSIEATTRAAHDALNVGMGTSAESATITLTCPDPCQRYDAITVEIQYPLTTWIYHASIPIRLSATRASELDRQTSPNTRGSPFPGLSLVPGESEVP